MENIEFKNACYEVLEILKHINEEDLQKIPEEEIQMLKRNANYESDFKYNPRKNIKEQSVSKLAKGIIAVYFYKYTATPKQKEKIKLKQEYDLKLIEENKKEKYNTNDIFKNRKFEEKETNISSNSQESKTDMIIYEERKWYQKIFDKILRILKK